MNRNTKTYRQDSITAAITDALYNLLIGKVDVVRLPSKHEIVLHKNTPADPTLDNSTTTTG